MKRKTKPTMLCGGVSNDNHETNSELISQKERALELECAPTLIRVLAEAICP